MRSRPCRSPLLLVPRIIFRANASTLPPLLRTTRPPHLFFLRLPWLPRHVERDLARMTKCWNYRPTNDILLAFFALSLEDRWKPFHSSNIALVFEMYTTVCSRFSRWLVYYPSASERFLLTRTNESLTFVRFKFELIFPSLCFSPEGKE